MYEEAVLVFVSVGTLRNLLNTWDALQVGVPKLDAVTAGAEVLHDVHECCYVEIRRI